MNNFSVLLCGAVNDSAFLSWTFQIHSFIHPSHSLGEMCSLSCRQKEGKRINLSCEHLKFKYTTSFLHSAHLWAASGDPPVCFRAMNICSEDQLRLLKLSSWGGEHNKRFYWKNLWFLSRMPCGRERSSERYAAFVLKGFNVFMLHKQALRNEFIPSRPMYRMSDERRPQLLTEGRI